MLSIVILWVEPDVMIVPFRENKSTQSGKPLLVIQYAMTGHKSTLFHSDIVSVHHASDNCWFSTNADKSILNVDQLDNVAKNNQGVAVATTETMYISEGAKDDIASCTSGHHNIIPANLVHVIVSQPHCLGTIQIPNLDCVFLGSCTLFFIGMIVLYVICDFLDVLGILLIYFIW